MARSRRDDDDDDDAKPVKKTRRPADDEDDIKPKSKKKPVTPIDDDDEDDAAKMGPDGAKYKDKKGKELFVAVVADSKDNPEKRLFGVVGKEKPKVESSTVDADGKSGSVVIKTADGKTETVPCVKEDGKWRVSITSKRGAR